MGKYTQAPQKTFWGREFFALGFVLRGLRLAACGKVICFLCVKVELLQIFLAHLGGQTIK